MIRKMLIAAGMAGLLALSVACAGTAETGERYVKVSDRQITLRVDRTAQSHYENWIAAGDGWSDKTLCATYVVAYLENPPGSAGWTPEDREYADRLLSELRQEMQHRNILCKR